MNIMFQMLNETRLEVGIMALGGSSAALQYAVDYARTRLQGAHFSRMFDTDAPKVPIIEHPDVTRMLMGMKGCIEAQRMLSYYVAKQIDLGKLLEGEAGREARALADILIPLVKAGNSENAWQITAEAIQVHGGYGYCSDYPVEQLAVDCKVLSIVEGTNGIQSLDLVMRKILLNPDQKNYKILKSRMLQTIESASGIVDDVCRNMLLTGLERMDSILASMKKYLEAGQYHALLLNVDPVRRAFFDLMLAWMHLWCLILARPKLSALTADAKGEALAEVLARDAEAAFYYGKVCASEFWLAAEFPKYFGKTDAISRSETVDFLPGNAVFSSHPCA